MPFDLAKAPAAERQKCLTAEATQIGKPLPERKRCFESADSTRGFPIASGLFGTQMGKPDGHMLRNQEKNEKEGTP